MSKIALFILIAAVGATAGVVGYLQTNESGGVVNNGVHEEPENQTDTDPVNEAEPAVAATITFDEDGDTLIVSAAAGTVLETLTIDQVNQWNQENWDTVFTERPSFGEMREVAFTDFARFDTAAAVTPDGRAVFFTVSDYAAASTISFIYRYDIEAGEFTVVADSLSGGVSDLIFSDDGSHVAMARDTARSAGDGLTVVSATDMRVTASLDGAAMLDELPNEMAVEPNEYMPRFGTITWLSVDTLSFTTDDTDGNAVSWTMAADGSNMEMQ